MSNIIKVRTSMIKNYNWVKESCKRMELHLHPNDQWIITLRKMAYEYPDLLVRDSNDFGRSLIVTKWNRNDHYPPDAPKDLIDVLMSLGNGETHYSIQLEPVTNHELAEVLSKEI